MGGVGAVGVVGCGVAGAAYVSGVLCFPGLARSLEGECGECGAGEGVFKVVGAWSEDDQGDQVGIDGVGGLGCAVVLGDGGQCGDVVDVVGESSGVVWWAVVGLVVGESLEVAVGVDLLAGVGGGGPALDCAGGLAGVGCVGVVAEGAQDDIGAVVAGLVGMSEVVVGEGVVEDGDGGVGFGGGGWGLAVTLGWVEWYRLGET